MKNPPKGGSNGGKYAHNCNGCNVYDQKVNLVGLSVGVVRCKKLLKVGTRNASKVPMQTFATRFKQIFLETFYYWKNLEKFPTPEFLKSCGMVLISQLYHNS